MSFLRPVSPPYDPLEWQRKPFAEKSRLVCQAWALQGYGTPAAVYGLYIAKVVLYVGMWSFFCSFTPGLGDPRSISSWWLAPIAFQKFALWSMVFEGLGLGCGSGPLAGRYSPMIGGFLYFLRPGTTKAPLFPGLPIVGRCRRSWLDVALYVAHNAFLFRALTSPQLTPGLLLPTAVLLPLLTLSDKTLFLAARGEHYFSLLVCFLFAEDWISASMGTPGDLVLGRLLETESPFPVGHRGHGEQYYAGNWPYSVWLFRGDSARKLDRRLVKSSGLVLDQLKRLYDEGAAVGLLGKVIAFREMHLHGRALQVLLPKAVDRIEEYEHFDGELIAGMVLGWNFGDGHLHDERLLEAVQEQCGFECAEVRCIFVESQPLCRPWLHWRIADAKAGRLDEGRIAIRHLQTLQPWASTIRGAETPEQIAEKSNAADVQR